MYLPVYLPILYMPTFLARRSSSGIQSLVVFVYVFLRHMCTQQDTFLTWVRIYDHVFTFTLLLRGCPNTNKMLFVTKSNLPKTGREEKCCLPKKLSQQSKWQQLRVKWYLVISFIIYDQNESKGHHTLQTYVPGQLTIFCQSSHKSLN